jgi:hypothetical protein
MLKHSGEMHLCSPYEVGGRLVAGSPLQTGFKEAYMVMQSLSRNLLPRHPTCQFIFGDF